MTVRATSTTATRASRPRVLLREVTEADLTVFFEHQRDPAANAMAGFPARERDAFMAHWAAIMTDGTVLVRTVLADGRVAGNVMSFLHEGAREVGYWIGREFWGMGVATRALRAFLRIEPRRPLYAGAARHNAASIRVLRKCSFALLREDDDECLFRLGQRGGRGALGIRRGTPQDISRKARRDGGPQRTRADGTPGAFGDRRVHL
jgi:RimJ/RimL family protein N-acetyltransferase